jgi:hypothetical protein
MVWWVGPKLLRNSSPVNKDLDSDSEEVTREQKIDKISAHVQVGTSLLDNCSFMSRLQRVMVWCRRFIMKCSMVPQDRVKVYPMVEELHKALQHWIILAQKDKFLEEILCLNKGEQVSNYSKLRCVNPFLNNEGILRVGGWLKKTPFSQGRKHPILLPERQINGTDFAPTAPERTTCSSTVNAGHTSTTMLDCWQSGFGSAIHQEMSHVIVITM